MPSKLPKFNSLDSSYSLKFRPYVRKKCGFPNYISAMLSPTRGINTKSHLMTHPSIFLLDPPIPLGFLHSVTFLAGAFSFNIRSCTPYFPTDHQGGVPHKSPCSPPSSPTIAAVPSYTFSPPYPSRILHWLGVRPLPCHHRPLTNHQIMRHYNLQVASKLCHVSYMFLENM